MPSLEILYPVIERAIDACKNSKQDPLHHFVDYHEMIELGKGASKDFPSVKLLLCFSAPY